MENQERFLPVESVLSIEQSRAIEEVQAALIIAKRFRREPLAARARILDACRRKKVAEESQYVYPRGGTQIVGPSIRFAEVLAQNWGNLKFGLKELTQLDGSSDVEAFAWDLETNTYVSRSFKVQHRRKAHGSYTTLEDPRDIYEMVANQGQRRVRACILEIIPGDIVEEAIAECDKTIKDGATEPIETRTVKMIDAFKQIGVPIESLEVRLGHKMSATIEQELIVLRKIYQGIKDGMMKREDYFSIPGMTINGKEGVDESMKGEIYKTKDFKPEDNHTEKDTTEEQEEETGKVTKISKTQDKDKFKAWVIQNEADIRTWPQKRLFEVQAKWHRLELKPEDWPLLKKELPEEKNGDFIWCNMEKKRLSVKVCDNCDQAATCTEYGDFLKGGAPEDAVECPMTGKPKPIHECDEERGCAYGDEKCLAYQAKKKEME